MLNWSASTSSVLFFTLIPFSLLTLQEKKMLHYTHWQKLLALPLQITKRAFVGSSIVTRFGKILKVSGNFSESLFSIWQNFEPTLATFVCYWAILYCCKLPNIDKNLAIWSHWAAAAAKKQKRFHFMMRSSSSSSSTYHCHCLRLLWESLEAET